jgi:DNA repair photolyase
MVSMGMTESQNPKTGRGTGLNPSSRFHQLSYGPSEDSPDGPRDEFESADGDAPSPSNRTKFFVDTARSILSRNQSPDVGFEYSINAYRGCEHGCVYCYARPTHEYLGLSAGEDFETKIFVKERAPELLRAELSKKSWQPRMIVMSGNTDCYQPIERKLRLTRRCLEIIADFRNPVFIITKNHLVTRDIDLLKPLAEVNAAQVMISVTTLDETLCATLEPRTSRPSYRLDAIRKLSDAGIPVAVNVAPVIPGLTDEEIPRILKACFDAGARTASYTIVRLPLGVKDIFEDWARRAYPDRADKILSRIREMRDGKLNDPNFNSRMQGGGVFAEQIRALFRLSCRKIGMNRDFPELSTTAFRNPRGQMSLFETKD